MMRGYYQPKPYVIGTIAFSCSVWLSGLGSAQLMLSHVPELSTLVDIRAESRVPAGLGDRAILRFESLDIYFDGGSYGAIFNRENGARFRLFFPNPVYWTSDAKRDSRQPVAIQSKSLVEIVPGSPLEKRILELLANDIVDGNRDRETTLTLIRIRDCLLNRKPLAEIIEQYDPDTWELKRGATDIGARVPKEPRIIDEQTLAPKHR